MKRFVSILALSILCAAGAVAQDWSPQLLKGLGIPDEKIAKLQAIQDDTEATLLKGSAQLRLAMAQLSALLVDANVAPAEVEKAVRAATEWEVQIKLTQIKRELAIRKLIGDQKWRELNRQAQATVRAGAGGGQGAKQRGALSAAGNADSAREKRIRALVQELNQLLNTPAS